MPIAAAVGAGWAVADFFSNTSERLSVICVRRRITTRFSTIRASGYNSSEGKLNGSPQERKGREKPRPGKKEHHLWMKRDSAGSGQKALNLVRIVSRLPNEKEAICEALDKWTAFENEFPVIAAAKALEILRRRGQWLRIVQVAKWLLSKGQVMTMGTFDVLLLALDMEGRVDEAEAVWCKLLETHSRSISKRLFSRMVSLYDRHSLPSKILETWKSLG
ncbi:pentatricopeptide repeat-containing protein At4g18975, chloroplastic-like isoform X2 [Wolffia australiana]